MFLFRVHDYRAFPTVQATLKTAVAVVSSHNLVSGGNGDTRGQVSSICTLVLSCARFLRLVCFLTADSEFLFFVFFSDLPR